jgi:hypothetical protein
LIRIQAAGRIGNILFLWAFAQSISRKNYENIEITFDKFNLSSYSSYIEIRKYLENEKVFFTINNWLGLLLKIIDFIGTKFPSLSKIISSVFKVHSGENIPNFKKVRIIRGYFQDLAYFEGIKHQIFDKISNILSTIFVERHLGSRFPDLNDKYQVIHLRLGDYKNEPFGVIKIFENTKLLDSGLPVIVCTDGDVSEIQKRLTYEPKLVLTPLNTDGWEVLAVMAKAEIVITSNSTLSWWGGVVACHNGGKSYFPNKWRKINNQSNPYPTSIQNAFEYDAVFE